MGKNMLNEVNTIRQQMGLPLLNEHELLHLELSKINLDPMNEGWWENAKYALSKLGRYKAGGNILGKSQTDAKANAQIMALLDKKGNEIIKALDTSIKQKNPEFPNNRSQEDFLNTILEIATVYDSLVAATKIAPDKEGYLPIDAANAIIEDLRAYAQKYLDVDLTAAFSVFNEEDESVEEEVIEEASSPAQQAAIAISKKEKGLDEANEDLDAAKSKVAGKFADTKAAVKKGDLKAYDTERMKTLKSWRLPIALMGAGASFGALSWLIEYLFPPEKITTMTPKEVTETVRQTFGNIKPGEGMTQIMNRTLGMNLSPSSNPNDVVAALSKLGGGNPQTGVDIITQKGGIFADPAAAKATLTELVKNPTGHGSTLKQVFTGTWAGTGKMAGDTLVTINGGTLTGLITKAFITWSTKTTVIKSAKALIAAPILKTIGIGLFAGGVVAALSRWKGRKSSRAQVLNDLIQYLRPVEGSKENPPVIDNGNNDEQGQGGNNGPLGRGENDLYIQLKNYFKDLYNFRSQVNSKSFYNKSTGNPSETPEYNIQPKDVDDLMKLMEEFNQIDEIKLDQLELSSNELKLLTSGIKRLGLIKAAIGRIKTNDQRLMGLINAAKKNPFYDMDVNTIIDNIQRKEEGKKFVNDFNAAIYGTKFKNGNGIIDQLDKIQVNKLQEKAVREPSKQEKMAQFAGRNSNVMDNAIKNLPGYLVTLYSIFSYLIDMIKANPEGNKGPRQDFKPGQEQSADKANANDGANSDRTKMDTAARDNAGLSGNSLRGMGRNLEEGQTLTKEQIMSMLNEAIEDAGGEQPGTVAGDEEFVNKASKHYKLMTTLAQIVPQYASIIAKQYRMNYPESTPISPKRLGAIIEVIFNAIANIPNGKMKTYIMNPMAGESGADIATFNAVINRLNEFEVDEANTTPTKPAQDLLKNSMNYKLLMAIASSMDGLKNRIYTTYNKQNPNDRISSPGKMMAFIDTVLKAAATINQSRMLTYVTNSGGNVGLYKGMKQYLETMEPGETEDYGGFDVENYLPAEVGNFNLRQQKPAFRKALALKAAEIAKNRVSGGKVDEDSINKTMIALITAINNKRSKEGLDTIPTV